MRMEFGTQDFFDRLRAGAAAGDADIYAELNVVIDRSLKGYVSGKVSPEDVGDVLQEIKLTVWKRLADFLLSSENCLPAQREAWLFRVAKSKVTDYYRRHSCRAGEIREDGERGWVPRTVTIENYLDRLTAEGTPEGDFIAEAEREIDRKKCERLIEFVCGINTTPERIIAFLYNSVILPASKNNKKRGSPQAVVQALSGKKLSEIRVLLSEDMNRVFDRTLPEEIYRELDRKLLERGEDTFGLAALRITLVSNNIKTSAVNNSHRILGGCGDD